MTQSFKDMMYLFACSAHGIEPNIKHQVNENEIFQLSVTQGIWPLTFLSLKKISTDERIAQWDNQIKYAVIRNVQKLYFSSKVIEKMEQKNIDYCLLKGEVLSEFYSNSDFRISGDTDIFVGMGQKKDRKSVV